MCIMYSIYVNIFLPFFIGKPKKNSCIGFRQAIDLLVSIIFNNLTTSYYCFINFDHLKISIILVLFLPINGESCKCIGFWQGHWLVGLHHFQSFCSPNTDNHARFLKRNSHLNPTSFTDNWQSWCRACCTDWASGRPIWRQGGKTSSTTFITWKEYKKFKHR